MPEKDELNKNVNVENATSGQNEKDGSATVISNPFEKGHAELSPEALENLEQYKEAQTERD